MTATNYPFDNEFWNDISKYLPAKQHPMVLVSWYDALAYAKWAKKRLPKQTEWLHAARGELLRKQYSWGNDKDMAREVRQL